MSNNTINISTVSNKKVSVSKAKQFLIAAALQRYEVVQYFVEVHDLHPDTSFGGKPTAICYAGLKRDQCLMMYLKRHGASVNIQDQLGMSPLHYTTLGGCEFCIAYLIHSGADVNLQDHKGQTPLSLANKHRRLAKCYQLMKQHRGSTCYATEATSFIH